MAALGNTFCWEGNSRRISFTYIKIEIINDCRIAKTNRYSHLGRRIVCVDYFL